MLERATRGGGATALSEGTIYFGGGTRVQKASGFEDTTEDMYRYMLMAGGPGGGSSKFSIVLQRFTPQISPRCVSPEATVK